LVVPPGLTILDRWDLEQNAQAAVELVKIMEHKNG
jgi:hypothetical protein